LALESALAQEDVTLEAIVVDDGSSDDTAEVLERHPDERVRLVRHSTSRGPAAARNAGIGVARGEWVAFLDDDDLWAPFKLRDQLEVAGRTGASFLYSAAIKVDEALRPRADLPAPDPSDLLERLVDHNVIPSISGVLAKRSLLSEVGGFDTRLAMLADWDMWLRLAREGVPAASTRPAVAYVVHRRGMSSQGLAASRREHRLIARRHRDLASRFGKPIGGEDFWLWMVWSSRMAGDRGATARVYASTALRFRKPVHLLRAGAAVVGGPLMDFGLRWADRVDPGGATSEWLEVLASSRTPPAERDRPTCPRSSDRGSAPRPVLWFSEVPRGYHNPEGQYKIRALRDAGHRVVVIHPIGAASLSLRKLGAAMRHLDGWLRRARRADSAVSESDVRLVLWPVRHGPLTRHLNGALIRWQLRREMSSRGIAHPILWHRFPTPELVEASARLGDVVTVYDCIDYIAERPLGRRGRRAARQSEAALCRDATLVLASSQELARHLAGFGARAVVLPHGVDIAAFQGDAAEPRDLQHVPRPRLGYIGGDDWVDIGLLSAVADHLPHASLVIVGPWRSSPALQALAARPNVFVLGPRSHASVPGYMAHLDAALLPYRMTAETFRSAPVKVKEYLAVGLPCVGTDVPYLRQFDHLMAVHGDRDRFIRAVELAVSGIAPGGREERRDAMRREDWAVHTAVLLAELQAACAQQAAGARPPDSSEGKRASLTPEGPRPGPREVNGDRRARSPVR
jgi:glycosyltransferase involved in cell wall biosynthesis